MRFFRRLLRLRSYPILILPIQRGPLHGFYHFFFGYFVPVFWFRSLKPDAPIATVDCGPFNQWFDLLPGRPVTIVSQSDAIKISYMSRTFGFANGYRVSAAKGWDKWLLFPKRKLSEISARLRQHLLEVTESIETSHPKVLVLGRSHTPSYYEGSLRARYGTAKRDIPNLRELADSLAETVQVEYVDPAEITPMEIVSKCLSAKAIIGQHGAALTNVFFLEPGSHLVEIGWPELSDPGHLGMYGMVSRELGVVWRRPILQTNRHSAVDPHAFLAAVGDIVGL